jgi:hypothetical protein
MSFTEMLFGYFWTSNSSDISLGSSRNVWSRGQMLAESWGSGKFKFAAV